MTRIQILTITSALAAYGVLAVPASGQTLQKLQLPNDSVSGFAAIESGGFSGFVNAFSAVFNGSAVTWFTVDLCRYNPDWEHRYCIFAQGAAPGSAIYSRGFEFVEVSVPDLSLYSSAVLDCTSGICGSTPLPQMALHATWTRYAGEGSFDSEQSGVFRNLVRYGNGQSASFTRSGISKGYSASFRGAVGTLQVEKGGMAGGPQISVSKGSILEVLRTP
jgi:hypothetical protein